MAVTRYLEKFILSDLSKKMVFIGGPRQVGKTTLSKSLCQGPYTSCEYFNWDNDDDRKSIRNKQWREDTPLVIFDELHKLSRWKQWIKGVYDLKPAQQQYIVTGSARLDVYKRGGDSLLGRYHYWRLHPLTLDELPKNISKTEGLERLLSVGGFPEPFIENDIRESRRWRRERFDRIMREDIRDLEAVRDIQSLSMFIDCLRERVSAQITLSNIAKDLQISPKTAKSWLNVIEKMYLAFPIYPLTKNIPRAIQKPPKVYFYDNADCEDDMSVRLENLVATHLIKRLHFLEDYFGYRCKLHYIRDKDGREVDFVTVVDNKIQDLIEVKLSDTDISTSLKYYKQRLDPKNTLQIVANCKRAFDSNGIRVCNPMDYFSEAPWETT